MTRDFHFEDFTEANYARLLDLARERRRFVSLHDAPEEAATCLWRHDIDISPQRALALGELEAAREIPAVYYVFLHSAFYGFWERAVVRILRRLLDLGHEVGLHFETEFYRGEGLDAEEMEARLIEEAAALGRVLGREVRSYTVHNPVEGDPVVGQDRVGELVNGFGPAVRERFEYCSDSNGYWRYQRLEDVLRAPVTRPLCVLTHPVWWVDRVMAPRERIQRALEGRLASVARGYDGDMADHGRTNLGADSES